MEMKTPPFNCTMINTKQITRKCYFTQRVGSLLLFKNSKIILTKFTDIFYEWLFVAAEAIDPQIVASGQLSTHRSCVTVFIYLEPFFFLQKTREIKCLRRPRRDNKLNWPLTVPGTQVLWALLPWWSELFTSTVWELQLMKFGKVLLNRKNYADLHQMRACLLLLCYVCSKC